MGLLMTGKYYVEFYFGVRLVKSFDLYVAAIFLSLLVNLISHYSKSDKKDLWRIIDAIGKQYKIRVINKLIISVPELLSGRVESEVSDAIFDYKNSIDWEKSPFPEPEWIDEKNGETPLGGTLGYTYDFTEKETDDE